MTNPILEMTGICKRFPGVVALDHVDLELRRGEIVAVAGENGAGKSTLMKILGGIYQPDEGRIRIDGKETFVGSVSDAIRRGIGFIHQELNVLVVQLDAQPIVGAYPRGLVPFSHERDAQPAEITDILARLKAIDASRPVVPMPKGPVPTSMKGMRGQMRGR